jgi:hypothetical protein
MNAVDCDAVLTPLPLSQNPWLADELMPPAEPIALRRGLISACVLAIPFYAIIGLIVWRLW